MPTNEESLLSFPCEFPLKVLGKDCSSFRAATRQIVEHHTGELDEESIRMRVSRNGRFLSITFTIQARSKHHLDALYHDLCDHKDVMMVL